MVSVAQVDAVVKATAAAATAWQRRDPAERAAMLNRVGDVLAARRGELIEVAASETGKTIDQSDPEVSEAIDFCRHYAETSLLLHDPAHMAGARFVPAGLTVVASPWNFPLAIPTGGVAAALARQALCRRTRARLSRCGSAGGSCGPRSVGRRRCLASPGDA